MEELISARPRGPRDPRRSSAARSPGTPARSCGCALGAAAAVDVGRLRARVAERIALAPALTRRLGGSAAQPGWVPDEEFDLTDHVVAAPVDGAGRSRRAARARRRLFEQRLDRSRPLWRIDTVALADGGSALIWRIHHALADGTASVRYARALLWDDGRRGEHDPGAGARRPRRRRGAPARASGRLSAPRVRARGVPLAVRRARSARAARSRSRPCRCRLCTTPPRCSAARPSTMWCWRSSPARSAAGCACATDDLGTIRVRVPVSMHHEGDEVANHDSFFSVALPLNERTRSRACTPRTRPRASASATTMRSTASTCCTSCPACRRSSTSSRAMEQQPAPLRAERLQRSRAARAGQRARAPVVHLHSIAEIGERHALRVSATSLAGHALLRPLRRPEPGRRARADGRRDRGRGRARCSPLRRSTPS